MNEILKPTFKDSINLIVNDVKESKNQVETMTTNYIKLSPRFKLLIVDTIIDHMKDVFGPTGGYTAKLVGNEKQEEEYTKTKDGHEFLSKLRFGDPAGETILSHLQNHTKYIAGYGESKTSRDGTTSYSMISCSVSKFMLHDLLKNDKEKYHKLDNIPSTVYNSIFDIMVEEGSKLMADNRTLIFDPEKREYINNGYKLARKALLTTADNDITVAGTFLDLVEKIKDEKLDIINANKAAVKRMESSFPKVEIQLQNGIKIQASSIDTNIAEGISNRSSLVFILDGYIEDHNSILYGAQLRNFITSIAKLTRNGYGILREENKINSGIDDILFLVTRVSTKAKDLYKAISTKGIPVTDNDQKTYNVYPKFLMIYDDEYDTHDIIFNDTKEVFKECVIDLNMLNKYINACRATQVASGKMKLEDFYNAELNKLTTAQADDAIMDFHLFWPQFHQIDTKSIPVAKIFDGFVIDKNDPTKLIKVVPELDAFPIPQLKTTIESIDGVDTVIASSYGTTLMNFLHRIQFEGSKLLVAPFSEEVNTRASQKRQQIQTLIDAYDETSAETNNLGKRLEFFRGLTISPIISSRSGNDTERLIQLFDDVFGVFESIHVQGVMPGTNTFLIKHSTEFKNNCINRFIEENGDYINKSKLDLYIEWFNTILDSVIKGYEYCYSFIDDEYEIHIPILRTEYKDNEKNLITYDVVSGEFRTSVIEAYRTTLDVFSGALSFAKDILLLKRLCVEDLRCSSNAETKTRQGSTHPINIVKAEREAEFSQPGNESVKYAVMSIK